MKPYVFAAAAFAVALPAAPALAHCGTAHHRVAARKIVHRVAYRAPLRRAAIRTACGCGPRAAYRAAYFRPAAYPIVYRPRAVRVVYVERPLYRPYRHVYAEPFYRPRPVFYAAGYGRWHGYDGGFRHERFRRYGGYAGGYGRHGWR
ncbi:MAG TPA: hypothetical protein VGD66_07625 [Allosphingosinicella sp.]|jgi:hypothetical protein